MLVAQTVAVESAGVQGQTCSLSCPVPLVQCVPSSWPPLFRLSRSSGWSLTARHKLQLWPRQRKASSSCRCVRSQPPGHSERHRPSTMEICLRSCVAASNPATAVDQFNWTGCAPALVQSCLSRPPCCSIVSAQPQEPPPLAAAHWKLRARHVLALCLSSHVCKC